MRLHCHSDFGTLLMFCPFSFSHCVVCSSSIYGFWLWYLIIVSDYGICKLFWSCGIVIIFFLSCYYSLFNVSCTMQYRWRHIHFNQGEVFSIQHYVIKLVSYLETMNDFFAIAVDITVNINTSWSCIETNKSRRKSKLFIIHKNH
jgi:hypothetical protein